MSGGKGVGMCDVQGVKGSEVNHDIINSGLLRTGLHIQVLRKLHYCMVLHKGKVVYQTQQSGVLSINL